MDPIRIPPIKVPNESPPSSENSLVLSASVSSSPANNSNNPITNILPSFPVVSPTIPISPVENNNHNHNSTILPSSSSSNSPAAINNEALGIHSIFYSEFDNQRGPSLLYQAPLKYVNYIYKKN